MRQHDSSRRVQVRTAAVLRHLHQVQEELVIKCCAFSHHSDDLQRVECRTKFGRNLISIIFDYRVGAAASLVRLAMDLEGRWGDFSLSYQSFLGVFAFDHHVVSSFTR